MFDNDSFSLYSKNEMNDQERDNFSKGVPGSTREDVINAEQGLFRDSKGHYRDAFNTAHSGGAPMFDYPNTPGMAWDGNYKHAPGTGLHPDDYPELGAAFYQKPDLKLKVRKPERTMEWYDPIGSWEREFGKNVPEATFQPKRFGPNAQTLEHVEGKNTVPVMQTMEVTGETARKNEQNPLQAELLHSGLTPAPTQPATTPPTENPAQALDKIAFTGMATLVNTVSEYAKHNRTATGTEPVRQGARVGHGPGESPMAVNEHSAGSPARRNMDRIVELPRNTRPTETAESAENWIITQNRQLLRSVDGPDGPNKLYETIDQAGKAAVAYYNSKSIKEDCEYGNVIMRDKKTGKFYFEPAEKGENHNVSHRIPHGAVGLYHTHGADSTSTEGTIRRSEYGEVFSCPDVTTSKGHQIPSYLGTPEGQYLRYDPDTGITRKMNYMGNSYSIYDDPKYNEYINKASPCEGDK